MDLVAAAARAGDAVLTDWIHHGQTAAEVGVVAEAMTVLNMLDLIVDSPSMTTSPTSEVDLLGRGIPVDQTLTSQNIGILQLLFYAPLRAILRQTAHS
jgi:hypothetical protein